MFKRILIANRGEIALRIIRACKKLNIETVAIYSVADKNAEHVRISDHAICIGQAPVSESYLNIPAILSAAQITKADAIHPGYGFLAENAKFAEICEKSNICFIGPNSASIALMGNKISAIKALQAFDILPVPGSSQTNTLDLAKSEAHRIGYPVLIKAAFAGGGRGMRIVKNATDFDLAYHEAKIEAKHACDNETIYIEKYLNEPRHIEFQVISDHYGHVELLGERDCSIQRRYQKIIEEGPVTNIPMAVIQPIREKLKLATQKLGYHGVGTYEFLYQDNTFYFIEMNTRLQVEHTVTEEAFNIDLCKWQILIAAGKPFQMTTKPLRYAIECRIVAENTKLGTPSPGIITKIRLPGGANIRIESELYQGIQITPYYDPMIMKVIASGDTRADALINMRQALNELLIQGIDTNISQLQLVLNQPWFITQAIHTNILTAAKEPMHEIPA
jgi:acetyl-CoA carboxylase biotin carboxylase subunit